MQDSKGSALDSQV